MRKEILVTIEDRGNPLTFEIREMPPSRLESWLLRALLLVGGAKAGLPGSGDLNATAASLYNNLFSLLENIDYDRAKPLLDELLTCCTRVIDGNPPIKQPVTPATVDGFIEDVTTLLKLRVEVVKLNMGFLTESGLLNSLARPEETPQPAQ